MYVFLSVAAAAAERRAQARVLVRQVEDVLRQVRGLHDAADLDRALGLDQLADRDEEVGREL